MSNKVGFDKILKNESASEHEAYLKEQIEKQFVNRTQSSYKKSLAVEPFIKFLELFEDSRYEFLHSRLNPGTIDEIHHLYKTNEATPLEIILFYIKRAIEYKHLNSIITLNPKLLEIVGALGAYDSNKSLFGIPILLKDNIGTGDGMANTGGSAYLKDAYLERDAFVVEKLREEGAIILGKANLSEWANFMTFTSSNGYSALGGQTTNAYGLFDVGGSSAGSAVAVSINLTPLALGTETAGSLVYPASQNNVVTIKPTAGLVSRDLIIPISETQDTAGPIANSVKDAAILLEIIKGFDERDNQSVDRLEYSYLNGIDASIAGKKIGIIANEAVIEQYREDDEILLSNVKQIFRDEGCHVEEMNLLNEAFDCNMIDILLYEFKRDLNGYFGDQAVKGNNSLGELIAFNQKDEDNRCPMGQGILEKSDTFEMTENDYEVLVNKNTAASTKALKEAFTKYDVVISISNYATTPYACGGFPVVNLPMGVRGSGEPVGVTLIGDQFDEKTIINVGHILESKLVMRKLPDICE